MATAEDRTPLAARCGSCGHVWVVIWTPFSVPKLPKRFMCPWCHDTKQAFMASKADVDLLPPPVFAKAEGR